MTTQQILRNWVAWKFPNAAIPADAKIRFEFEKVCEEGWFTEHSISVYAGRKQLAGPAINVEDIQELIESIIDTGTARVPHRIRISDSGWYELSRFPTEVDEMAQESNDDWVGPDGPGLYVTCIDPDDENYGKFLYGACAECGHPQSHWTRMIDAATCWFWRDSAIEVLSEGYIEGKNVLILSEAQIEAMFPEEDS